MDEQGKQLQALLETVNTAFIQIGAILKKQLVEGDSLLRQAEEVREGQDSERWLTTEEFCSKYGISRPTLIKWRKSGRVVVRWAGTKAPRYLDSPAEREGR